jgi:hypothetical protein
MIEDRRALADALANEYEGGHTEKNASVPGNNSSGTKRRETRCDREAQSYQLNACAKA